MNLELWLALQSLNAIGGLAQSFAVALGAAIGLRLGLRGLRMPRIK